MSYEIDPGHVFRAPYKKGHVIAGGRDTNIFGVPHRGYVQGSEITIDPTTETSTLCSCTCAALESCDWRHAV